MIRGFHIADLHLGLTTYGTMDSKEKINTRTLEGLVLLDHVIAQAKSKGDVLFIAGDIYETPNPPNRIREEFEKRMVYCNSIMLPVVFITGNHCTPKSEGSMHPFIADRVHSLPNIFLIDKVGVQKISVKNGDTIDVLGLPHMYPKDWQKYGENSAEAVASIIKDAVVGENASVILGHLSISGLKNHYQRNELFSDEFSVPKDVFQAAKNFGAVILGHIHQQEDISDKIWYSGSLFPNDFGEEQDRKGYVYFEIDKDNTLSNRKFVAFDDLYTRFKTIRVFLDSEDGDPTATLLKAIANANINDCITRLFYEITEHQLLNIDMGRVRESLKKTAYFDIGYNIIDDSKGDDKPRMTSELKPSEAVEMFCEARGGEYKNCLKDLTLLTNDLVDEVKVDRDMKLKSLE